MSLSDVLVSARVRGRLAKAFDLGVNSVAELNVERALALRPGEGAGQVDVAWFDERTILASSDDDLDLTGGTLTDPFGDAVTFDTIKGLFVYAKPSNTSDVIIGAADSNAWTGPFGGATETIAVQPGGLLLLVTPDETGWPVTADSEDILRISNAGGDPITYEIVLLGA